MAGDPPLNQVVAKTAEAGYRGQIEGHARWSAGWFRTETRNDILFVSAPQTGFGYFKNFGKTLRQGLELDFDTDIKRVNLGFSYTFLDATFQSPEVVNGSAIAPMRMHSKGSKASRALSRSTPAIKFR